MHPALHVPGTPHTAGVGTQHAGRSGVIVPVTFIAYPEEVDEDEEEDEEFQGGHRGGEEDY